MSLSVCPAGADADIRGIDAGGIASGAVHKEFTAAAFFVQVVHGIGKAFCQCVKLTHIILISAHIVRAAGSFFAQHIKTCLKRAAGKLGAGCSGSSGCGIGSCGGAALGGGKLYSHVCGIVPVCRRIVIVCLYSLQLP